MSVASDEGLGWGGIVRLGLVQTALGAVVLVVTSTMNRVMVVELALPAAVPGALVALHYAVQLLRPRLGYGSDLGGRRTPWIIGGMAVLASGGVLASAAVGWMSVAPVAGIVLAVLAFVLVGCGVGASGTSLLLLLARLVAPARRPGAATLVWLMMLAGFAGTAAFIGRALDPFSPERLVAVTALVAGAAFLLTVLAVWGVERDGVASARLAGGRPAAFREALAQVWAEPVARGFTIFIFVSMFAYSAQEMILEPFAGKVFAMTPGGSARLAGLLHGGVFAGMLLAAVGASLTGRRGGAGQGVMRNWAIGGCVASAVAMAGLAAAGQIGADWPLRANVVLLGVANGSFVTAAISSMMALAGVGRAGREGVRMGLWGAAQAIAFAVGGLSGSLASDLARSLFGTPVAAYSSVFLAEMGLFVLAAWQAARVFRSRPADGHRDMPVAAGMVMTRTGQG